MTAATPLDEIRRHYPVLTSLSDELTAELARVAHPFRAPTGAVLFDMGGPCTGFILILEGSVEVTRPSSTGRTLTLYQLAPGDTCVLTVNCLVGQGSYPARASARTPVRGLILPRPMFDRLMDEAPTFRRQMLTLFASRLSRLLTLVEGIAFSPVEQRLAAVLVELGPRVSATHQELADMLGTAREVVSRQLGAWSDAGLVTTTRGLVVVREPRRLAAIAEPLGSD